MNSTGPSTSPYTDPFDPRSPFEALERARRQRFLIATSNFLLVIAVPIIIPFFVMFIEFTSWQTAFVLTITFFTIPVALLARRLAQDDRVDWGGLILQFYFLLIIGSNGVLIDGLFPAVAPSYAAFTVMAGMVLGPRGGYAIGSLAAVLWATSALLIGAEWITPVSLSPVLLAALVGIIVMAGLIMIAFLSQLATQDLRRALNDATYELVQTNRRLEEASRLKSQFMASTSHELRTPLSAITVFTDLTLRKAYGPLTEKQTENLERVLQNARRLTLLINDLLDLAKIEAGEMDITEEPFVLVDLVETIQTTVEPLAKDKNLGFSITVKPDLPAQIVGDEHRLSQVLINLSHNAVKFTREGEVSIVIAPTGNNQWKIVVQDTGSGIHERDRAAIFEAFRQSGHTVTNEKRQGTGLGLAISRHLVELMGGNIDVESEVGKGSTFKVTLPLKMRA